MSLQRTATSVLTVCLRSGDNRTSLERLGEQMKEVGAGQEGVAALLNEAMSILGEERFKALYPQYLQGDWYEVQVEAITKLLVSAREDRTWTEALDEAKGVDCVPIIDTQEQGFRIQLCRIHRSRGRGTLEVP